jgi:hypothetical protein
MANQADSLISRFLKSKFPGKDVSEVFVRSIISMHGKPSPGTFGECVDVLIEEIFPKKGWTDEWSAFKQRESIVTEGDNDDEVEAVQRPPPLQLPIDDIEHKIRTFPLQDRDDDTSDTLSTVSNRTDLTTTTTTDSVTIPETPRSFSSDLAIIRDLLVGSRLEPIADIKSEDDDEDDDEDDEEEEEEKEEKEENDDQRKPTKTEEMPSLPPTPRARSRPSFRDLSSLPSETNREKQEMTTTTTKKKKNKRRLSSRQVIITNGE